MKKRKQHYVWRYYLRSWSENEKIFCLRDGKIFESNLMGVANKRDFYRLKELNLDDIKFIKKFAIDPSPPHLQKLHYNLIKQFNSIPFELKSYVDSKGIDDSKLKGEIDKAINNLEEDLHGGIESSAIKYIDSILREDIKFFNTDEGKMEFIYFLCVQYMRTQKIKLSVLNATSVNKSINTEKIWNVLSHILATNMGWNLYANRKFKMVLLKNNSVKEFITGDQPVINTYATSVSNLTPPDKLEFYYPVSPSLAILITEKENHKESNRLALNEKDVVSYNKLIVKNCHDQIYATSKSILEEYKDQ